MKKLSGNEFEDLQKALISAFPNQTALEQMVKFCLDRDLAEIAAGINLSETIFELIKWAETYGQLNKLITKAHQRNPQNPSLDEFFKDYRRKNRRPSPNYIKRKAATRNTLEETHNTAAQPDSEIEISQSVSLLATLDAHKIHGTEESAFITESDWLNHFGFVRSPFERLEAGSEEFAEPGFLSTCFVDPDCFLDILGQANAPITKILYARRGEGKTACRVMLEYLCQHGGVPDKKTGQPAYVLSVPHIYMHIISDVPDIENQVAEIMRRAIYQFANLLADTEKIRRSLDATSQAVLIDINWYINYYSSYLTAQQLEFLSHAHFKIPFDSLPYPVLNKRSQISSLDHLRQWCRLMNTVGIKAVYVLVDGLDELASTAADLSKAYNLLSPLITNRELLDKTPYFALKFFLPSEMKNLILADKAGRPELIPAHKIKWSQEKLKELLRERILYFRRQDYQQHESGFEEFCVPELYGTIEDDLIQTADFNPRLLLKFCDLVVKAHCTSNQFSLTSPDTYKITSTDLQNAEKQFERWRTRHSRMEIRNPVPETLDIPKIIDRGESAHVEFKSSLLRDLSTNQQNDGLLMKIGKELAGMLNSLGGMLLIGVADDKSILGIEGDFQFLGQRNKNRLDSKKQDIDGFQLKLVDLIKANMETHVLGYIGFHFETMDDKTICVIMVQPSSQPVYFGKLEEFYIRSGTSNIQLKTHEIVSYVRAHWPK